MMNEEQSKLAVLIENVTQIVGEQYAELMVKNATRDQLLMLIEVAEEKGLNQKDMAKIAIGFYFPARITFTVPIEGVYENREELQLVALHMLGHIQEDYDVSVTKVELNSMFPPVESHMIFPNAQSVENYDQIIDHMIGDGEEEEEQSEGDKKEWVDRWSKMMDTKNDESS